MLFYLIKMALSGKLWLEVEGSGMFVGEYRHSLDDKSRIVLPSKFRSQLSSTIYVSLDFDNCLSLYSEEEFQKKAETINQLDEFDTSARALKRIFFTNSYDTNIDKQGRVSLSKSLQEKVGIIKNIVIVGAFNHIQIFSEEEYNKRYILEEKEYEQLASKFARKKDN